MNEREMNIIERVILSTWEKKGIVELAQFLITYGVEIMATEGTAHMLMLDGIEVIKIEDYTGFPEMMDGRLKTLHPKIHGGLRGHRDNPHHRSLVDTHGIKLFDLVVVILQPIGDVDIGGHAIIRSAAENWRWVTAVVDSKDYALVMEEMEENKGAISIQTNHELATKAFELTSSYDRSVAQRMREEAGRIDFSQ